jgi:hypothetical protein
MPKAIIKILFILILINISLSNNKTEKKKTEKSSIKGNILIYNTFFIKENTINTEIENKQILNIDLDQTEDISFHDPYLQKVNF